MSAFCGVPLHIFFHSGIKLVDRFLLLFGPEFGIDPLGDFYSGMAKEALGGVYIYVQFEHERGGAVADIVGADGGFAVAVDQACGGTIPLPHSLIAPERHQTTAFSTTVTGGSRE